VGISPGSPDAVFCFDWDPDVVEAARNFRLSASDITSDIFSISLHLDLNFIVNYSHDLGVDALFFYLLVNKLKPLLGNKRSG
jgi:hypothetical protein